MIVCEIEKVLPYGTYEIKAGSKRYSLVLEFYGVAKPKAADKLLIHEILLDKNWEGYTQPYAFELKQGVKPELVMEANYKEYIVLGVKGKNYVLKRIYG